MGNAAVLDMKGEPVKPKAKKQRATIDCIEEQPRPDWFVQFKGQDGKTWWFLRLAITRLRARHYGPFAIHKRRFESRMGHYPIVENELYLHAISKKA